MDYFNFVKPTYIENWPKELMSLSVASVDIPLSIEEAEKLGGNIKELYEFFPKPYKRDVSDIINKIDNAVNKFPKGAFIRLGSRSPKDSWFTEPKINSGIEGINRLTDCSERVCDDLSLAIKNNYNPHIFVREWINILDWGEFRCFMKNRKLVGISEYNYRSEISNSIIKTYEDCIKFAIELFFNRFKGSCHLDDVVFDVFVNFVKNFEYYAWEVKLLEINPYFEMTDPCLFDWRKPEMFNGQFLYRK